MSDMLIKVSADVASDSWGFVGVVCVGEAEAFRTLEAFATPELATTGAQQLMADVLGELLAGREWRTVRDVAGRPPIREDFNFSALRRQRSADEEPKT